MKSFLSDHAVLAPPRVGTFRGETIDQCHAVTVLEAHRVHVEFTVWCKTQPSVFGTRLQLTGMAGSSQQDQVPLVCIKFNEGFLLPVSRLMLLVLGDVVMGSQSSRSILPGARPNRAICLGSSSGPDGWFGQWSDDRRVRPGRCEACVVPSHLFSATMLDVPDLPCIIHLSLKKGREGCCARRSGPQSAELSQVQKWRQASSRTKRVRAEYPVFHEECEDLLRHHAGLSWSLELRPAVICWETDLIVEHVCAWSEGER